MKIAVWHNLPSGGGKRALYEHIRGLKRRGHSIETWCPSSADTGYLPLRELVVEHVIPLEWREPSSRGRVNNLLFPFRTIHSKLAAMERHCGVCAEQIGAKGFDLLFANSCQFFRAPPIGRMLGNLPKVLYLQEPYRWLYEALPKLAWLAPTTLDAHPLRPANLRRSLRDWVRLQALQLQGNVERTNAGSFDKILVNSLFSRESVLRAYGLDAEVCYLGISAELFQPTNLPRERFVVGVGSLTYEKGADIAIHAIATIDKAKRPKLVWIANLISRPYQKEIQALAALHDVDIVVKNHIPDEEVIGILNRAALMIYSSRLEPFGLAPLEANACRTPVVAIAEGGVRETIRHMHNGLLVESRDPVALGRAVVALLEDPGLARQLGSRGRQDVQGHWSWDAAVERLESRLNSVRGAALALAQEFVGETRHRR